MPFRRFQFASQKARLAGLALLLAPLMGCQNIAPSGSAVSQLRIIDATPPELNQGVDIYLNGTAIAYNLGSGAKTSYVPLTPGNYTVSADTAGSKQQLVSTKSSLLANKQYTAVLGSNAASLQFLVLTDQSQPAPSGQVALRFIDQATHVGPVDIYLVPSNQKLTAVNAVLSNIAFNNATFYINVPSDDYSIVFLPTGTVPTSSTTALYTGPVTTYPAGSARTEVMLDQQILNNPSFRVVEVPDYDSATSTQ